VWTGHASQQRHRAMLWALREAWYGCSFSHACAARLHAYRATAAAAVGAVHLLSRTHATCSSSLQQHHHRAGAVHYSLLRRGEKHTHGFITGWSARVATCALACPARSATCGSQYCSAIISFPEVISQTTASTSSLPITNHCCGNAARVGSARVLPCCSPGACLRASLVPLILLCPRALYTVRLQRSPSSMQSPGMYL